MIARLLREEEEHNVTVRAWHWPSAACRSKPAESRSRDLVDRATEAAVDLWLAHSRAGTADVLLPLEAALKALPELEGRYRGQPLLAHMLAAGAVDFSTLAAAFGPEAATPKPSRE